MLSLGSCYDVHLLLQRVSQPEGGSQSLVAQSHRQTQQGFGAYSQASKATVSLGSPETVALVGLTVDSKALLCLSLTLAQQETVIPPGLETH